MRIIALLLIFLIASCSSKRDSEIRTVICGKIEEFDANISNFISLTYSIYGVQRTEYAKIEANGDFWFSIRQEHAIDYKFNFNNKRIRLYTEPGDSTYLIINANKYPEEIDLNGDNQDFNKSYLQFQEVRSDYFEEYIAGVDSVSMISSDALKAYVISTKEKNPKFVQEYSAKNNWSNKFNNWALTNLDYEITIDLTFYRGAKDESFYDYYETFEIDNSNAIDNYRYWEFLQGYLIYLLNIKTSIPQDSISLSIIGQCIIDNSSGSGKDYLLALSYLWGIDNAMFTYEQLTNESINFFKLVESEKIKQYLFSYYEDYIPTIESDQRINIKSIELSSDVDQIFKDLSGRSIYGKIWADWCGSCINSMPEFIEAKQLYDNIEFILISIDSNKENIDKILSHFGIKEACYFLDKNQSSDLKRKFKIESIPHYFIIDRNGDFVKLEAMQPNSFITREILESLN